MPGSSSSSLSTSAPALAATIATAAKQRRQQQQQQHSKNLQQKLVYRINGLPALSLGTILIAAVSIINFFAILQTNALNISIATAENHTALQQQQQQQQQQQNLQLHPQQQELEERQQQSQLLAAIEKTLTINHTLKSFSIIDVARTAAAVAAVIETEAEVDKQPVFDFGMPRNITTRTGQAEATIKCRVNHLNDKSVSWIRKRDLHILTVATSSYTSDKRFEATQTKDAREWTLHVKAPQPRDSGIYECQVNTEPKMSMAFQLNIIVTSPDAKAIISGPPDLHFKVGSAIILNCIVQQPSFKDIGPIYWYRGEQMLTPLHKQLDEENAVADADDDDDVAVTVAVDGQSNSNSVDDVERDITNDVTKDFVTRIAMESQLGDTLKSRLRISNAQTTDTGNYTCQPTTASSASVMVHVINDENPAAMQKSRATALCSAINIIAAAVTMTDITAKVAPLFCWLSTIVVIVVAIAVLVLAVYSDVDFMGGGGIGHISHLLFIGKMSKNFFLFEVTTHNIETAIRIMRNFERKCISLTLK